ncbi:tRNA lysidine(34) synthetase TilS [bacterium]|nr:tRNA lysidine(34) synthetase TilS [bacterium]
MDLKEKFRADFKEIVAKTGFSGKNFSVLAACSGGADSLALLYLLNELRRDFNFELAAAYVSHRLRKESEDEAKFVDKICQELEITCFSLEFEENFWIHDRKNIEERARVKRYELLFDLVKSNKFSMLATAHHLDDQTETVLMRIFDRGTGLKGLSGIKAVNSSCDFLSNTQNGAFFIIRPMLSISKSEISAFMQGRQFLSDPSNYDTKYRRNYYRHKILPALDELLPEIPYKENIARLAENAARESEIMRELMDDFWRSLMTKNVGDTIFVPRNIIKSKSYDFWLTAFSYLFSSAVFVTSGIHRSPSTKTLHDIVDFIFKTDPATAYYTPFTFERTREGVRFRYKKTPPERGLKS